MRSDNGVVNQFLLLLAGSGMSDEQLVHLMRHLKASSTDVILEEVRLRRGEYNDLSGKAIHEVVPLRINSSKYIAEDRGVVANIERMLVHEAGLPKSRAAREIGRALTARHPEQSFPSFNPKDGFAKWLGLVLERISLGELLHVVAVLRNDAVGRPLDDWIRGDRK